MWIDFPGFLPCLYPCICLCTTCAGTFACNKPAMQSTPSSRNTPKRLCKLANAISCTLQLLHRSIIINADVSGRPF